MAAAGGKSKTEQKTRPNGGGKPARKALPPVARPALAKFSRPRLYNVQKRERLFELLDERRVSIRSSGSPVRRGQASRRWSQATSTHANCRASGSRPIAGDADPATFFHYLTSRRPTSRVRRPRTPPRCRGSRAEYTGDLPAFTRRFLREFFALFPPGSMLVVDNFHEAPRPTPRGASRSPKGCARFPRASTSCSCRGAAAARDGAARRRADDDAHRVGSAALHRRRGGGR